MHSLKKLLYISFLFLCTGFFNSLFAQKIGVLTGPSGIPCSYLMENKSELQFEVFSSAQQLLPKLLKGEIDAGFLPPNVAAKAYNYSSALVCLAITGNGNIYLISKNPQIKLLQDLKGKKIACAGMGATPEYVTRYLLNALNVKDVELDFSTPNPQIAAMVSEGKFECAIVPEPFATVAAAKDSSIKIVENLSSVYETLSPAGTGSFPMTLFVANKKYADSHKSELKKLAAEVKKAGEWTVKNPEKAGKLAEKHNIGLKATVAEKAIPNCNFTFVPVSSKKCRERIETLLSIFMEFDPKSTGGKLPDQDFYR